MPVAPMRNLGPCHVRWDPSGANIDLNPTKGGVKARLSLKFRDILDDQHGETPVDAVTAGMIAELEVPMTEFSLHQLSEVIAGCVIAGTKLTVKSPVGGAMLANAKPIIIKPAEDNVATPTTTQWTRFHRCFPVIDKEFTYDSDNQRVAKVLFKVFPDDVTATLNELYYYGV